MKGQPELLGLRTKKERDDHLWNLRHVLGMSPDEIAAKFEGKIKANTIRCLTVKTPRRRVDPLKETERQLACNVDSPLLLQVRSLIKRDNLGTWYEKRLAV